LRNQLDRASVSIVLNLAEGVGRRSARDKAHFYTIACGSATECAAVMDLLLARGLVTPSDHRHARGLLVRVVQMLTRMAQSVSKRSSWQSIARVACACSAMRLACERSLV
jgi:four helix bundle protein